MCPQLICQTKLPLPNIIKDFIITISYKRRSTAQHNVQNQTAAPYIAFLIIIPVQYLRRDIIRSPNSLIHPLLIIEAPGSSKINHFQRRVCFVRLEKQVFRFEISMTDVRSMTVGYCRDNVVKIPRCDAFRHEALGNDFLEQLSASAELGDEVVVLGFFYYLI
jgi:hypothetical protein